MATDNSEYKKQAFKFFSDGFTVKDLVDKLPVNKRTLYRWFDDFLNDTDTPIQKKKRSHNSEDALNKIEETKELISKSVRKFKQHDLTSEEWVNLALNHSLEGCLKNKLITDKLSDLLVEELDQPEVNLKAVSCYSNAIQVHAKLEMAYGQYQILTNSNLAIANLESQGYIVSVPHTIDTDAA